MEQQYILKNCKSFELKDIFECGQCFRWNPNEDGSYTGVFGNNVINVSKKENARDGIVRKNRDHYGKYIDFKKRKSQGYQI